MTDRRDLDGSSSICVNPAYAPITYHWFRRDPARRLVDEVSTAIDAMGVDDSARDRLIGDLSARLLRLETGRLVPRKHIKGPMESVTNIEIFEVRASAEVGEDETIELRVYHVEPRKLARKGGSVIVGLHVHGKNLNPAISINAAQDAELQIAVDRFFAGATTRWGIS